MTIAYITYSNVVQFITTFKEILQLIFTRHPHIVVSQMENIEQFLKGSITFGLKAGDCFQTADLYEAQNMSQVGC